MSKNHIYKGFRDLKVYQLSYQLATEMFELTKTFPKEEQYSLVNQIRRSSRSVSANIAEAWYKRKYQKLFVNKLIEAASEAGETQVWIDFSCSHGYLNEVKKEQLHKKYTEVGKMLSSMINNPNKFCY